MIVQQPAAIARVLGLSLCLISTWLAATRTVDILGRAPHILVWKILADFGFAAFVAFSLTSIGEWLWSFEEGWHRLQRALRILQAVILLGGLAFAFTIRIEKAFNLI